MADPLEDKYTQLVAQGWGAAAPEPYQGLPVGDGLGVWFGWTTAAGVPVAIYRSVVTGPFEVHGSILNAYRSNGGPQGALGYPISDEKDDVNDHGATVGRVSEFQWGSIFYDSTHATVNVMITGPVEVIPNVQFKQFLNEGVGVLGRPLGEVTGWSVIMNAVELQFTIQPAAHLFFRDLRPIQWGGPEVVWIKQGNPVTANWIRHRSSNGIGADGPDPNNVARAGDVLAYYDNPGPDTAFFRDNRPSRIRSIQNFTGWVAGTPLAGGPEIRLCPVAAWYSIVDIYDEAPDAPQPRWSRWQSTTSLGWADTSAAPP